MEGGEERNWFWCDTGVFPSQIVVSNPSDSSNKSHCVQQRRVEEFPFVLFGLVNRFDCPCFFYMGAFFFEGITDRKKGNRILILRVSKLEIEEVNVDLC